MTPREFSRRIRELAQGVPENVEKLVRQTGFAALQAVTLATPVDTGRARSNWLVSKDQPFGGQVGVRSAQATLDAGRSVIDTYSEGEALYISNNVPYIGRLNEGWSAQAPAGFVEKGVAAARALVASQKVVP